MIEKYEIALTIFLGLIGLITYKGIKDANYRESHIFHTDSILKKQQYYRIISSGFLHADWIHLLFNGIALYSFGVYVLVFFGFTKSLIIYFGSLISGSLLSLYVHRNHGDYRALGASGAVFGIVFASIVHDPLSNLSIILIPIEFPSWLMGAILILISIVGIKKGIGNIGHDAHLGGAIFGVIATAVMLPNTLADNWWVYLLLGLPTLAFIYLIIRNPNYLLVEDFKVPSFQIGNKIEETVNEEEELNFLLDKISKKGIESLSEKERAQLDKLSKGK